MIPFTNLMRSHSRFISQLSTCRYHQKAYSSMINKGMKFLKEEKTFNNEENQSHQNKWYRTMGVILSSLILTYFVQRKKIEMVQDNQIKNLRKIMKTEQAKLRAQFGQLTVYPEVKIQLRGNSYTIQFEIDQRKTDIFLLLINFLNVYNNLKGFKALEIKAFTNKDGIVTHYVDFQEQDPQWKSKKQINIAPQKGRLTITGINSNERPSFRIIFQKNDVITDKDIQALKQSYKQSVKPKRQILPQQMAQQNVKGNKITQSTKQPQNLLYKKLEEFGVTVFDPKDKTVSLDWDSLAGYEYQKRAIQDTVLLALNYPEIYDQITEGTRIKYQPNRPKAVLFEGPPGTGKTTSAKIIAQQVNIPLIYMPIESIMSKYYGDSQKKLAEFWEVCKKIGKVIIFIDEIDAIAGSRQKDMHEASRRILSTLLRKIDSFESTTDVLLICATNRKQDLDPAMLSRIDLSIKFNLPDKHSRGAIFRRYAKHLKDKQLTFLSEQTQGFSGRNISDVCKHAQRRWASKLIRKETEQKLPTLDEYIRSLQQRKSAQLI